MNMNSDMSEIWINEIWQNRNFAYLQIISHHRTLCRQFDTLSLLTCQNNA